MTGPAPSSAPSGNVAVSAGPPSVAPKMLIIATLLCSYPGIDATGQAHLEYPPNTYVIPTPDPVMFPERFYLYAFERGIDGILIASCGTDSPYEGSYEQLAARVNVVYRLMRDRGLDVRRLKLTSICSVCTKAFVKEVEMMTAVLGEIGPVERPLAVPS
jgi:F420-non-reducing hydrogenase iron-sulfur subunit